MDEGYLYLAKLIMNKIIKDPGVKSIDNTMGEDILSLVLNHATKLELVKKCDDEEQDWYYHTYCKRCNGTKEITRPMTVAEVLEWAENVAIRETTPIEGGAPFPDYNGGRVRVLMLLLTLLEVIPLVILVNSVAAIPAAIWIKGHREAILIPVILCTMLLRSMLNYVLGGIDIVFSLTIVLVGLLSAAATNAIVRRVRNRN